MTVPFKAEVFQNEFLPAGSREVHAIMTVTAGEDTASATAGAERVFGIVCDVSGSMEGEKMQAAKGALMQLVQMLPEECTFFLATGCDSAALLCGPARATAAAKAQAFQAIGQMRAFGGTRMSHWIELAATQFRHLPAGLRQAVLLTDGQNDADDNRLLLEALARCEGLFACDCRGVGTDWQVEQLRLIASRLPGTVDLVRSPAELAGDFRSLMDRALAKTVSDVRLRLWTPQQATVKFLKEVSPEIVDLTQRARQPSPQVRDYPTGAWGKQESRDFHLCIEVVPGAVGDEVLAGRISLLHTRAGVETKVTEARMLAIWTDDYARSTRMDRVVAHYTGQAELAASIHDGLEARAQGDDGRATVLLGRAVQLAHSSGNQATARLLERVVEVEDAERGTVRLRPAVDKLDAMALDTRSTRTTRLPKS